MKLLQYAFLGTATVFILHYLTKKRVADGNSIIDDLIQKGPKLMAEVNDISKNIKRDYRQAQQLY